MVTLKNRVTSREQNVSVKELVLREYLVFMQQSSKTTSSMMLVVKREPRTTFS